MAFDHFALETTMQVQPATTEVPQLVGGRYRVLALRGSGAEASVYLATDLFTGREVALKLGSPERLPTEDRPCASFSHPHLAPATAPRPLPPLPSLPLHH